RTDLRNGTSPAPQTRRGPGARLRWRRQDNASPWLSEMARRNWRTGRSPVVRLPRHPQRRIRDQPDRRDVLQRELPPGPKQTGATRERAEQAPGVMIGDNFESSASNLTNDDPGRMGRLFD